MTTMNFDDSIEALQQELDRRLNHAEGETEEERTEFRKELNAIDQIFGDSAQFLTKLWANIKNNALSPKI